MEIIMVSLFSWVLFVFSPVLGGQHVATEGDSSLLNPPAQQLLLPAPKTDHGLIFTIDFLRN